MKITRLQVENFKRIKAIDITPNGTIQVVAGKNAQGKTSVLDSFLMALQYAAGKKINFTPVRDGEEKATVKVELSEGNDVKFNLTHTFLVSGTHQLVLESPEGARFPSPQKMLDDLVGALSMDPLEFAHAAEKVQRETLLGLVELPFQPDAIAGQRLGAYEARTDVNRRIKVLEGQIAGMKVPPAGLPEEEVASADVLSELRTAQERNDNIVTITRALADAALGAARLSHDENQALAPFVLSASAAVPAPVNLDQYQEKLTSLEDTNALIREGQRRAQAVTAKETLDAEAAAFTAKIDGLDDIKKSGLAAAKMPLEGLGFDDDGVTYHGVPFSQASGAERVRVSVTIAMALNPKLRVIRITDGSLLDSDNMALIEQMATDEDFQVWVERVDESGTVGIIIEDGSVVTS